MSSPMFEIPDHLLIAVNVNGDGPLSANDPEFDHYACWCGDRNCDVDS